MLHRNVLWLVSLASLVFFGEAFAASPPESFLKKAVSRNKTEKQEELKAEIAENALPEARASSFEVLKRNIALSEAAKTIAELNDQGFVAIAQKAKETTAEGSNLFDIVVLGSEIMAINDFLAYSEEQSKEEKMRESCDYSPCVRRCKSESFIAEVEFLYWHVVEDGLIYGLKTPSAIPGAFLQSSLKPMKTYIIEPDWDWDPGVRLSMGYNTTYYGWDALMRWTYMKTDPETNTKADNQGILVNTLDETIIFGFKAPVAASEVHSKWKLTANILDWEIGRKYHMSRKLVFRPHGGLKTAWIHQHLFGNYFDIRYSTEGSFPELPPLFTVKNNFWGIGPCIGTDARWIIPGDVGFLFNMAVAGLMGKFNTDFNFGNQASFNYKCWRAVPMLQLFAGIDWGFCYCKRWYNFKAGYEFQYWWNQRRFPDFQLFFSTAAPVQDLMMHGLSAGVEINF